MNLVTDQHTRSGYFLTALGCSFVQSVRFILSAIFAVMGVGLLAPVHAQQLDESFRDSYSAPTQGHAMVVQPAQKIAPPIPPKKVEPAKAQAKQAASKSSDDDDEKPFSVTVSKTLYLPPAMYGQWTITSIRLQTDNPENTAPTISNIWILEREGDQVVVSNPANGASAAINVDKVEGDTASFHRQIVVSRNRILQENPTITVQGDTMRGQNLIQVFALKNGVAVKQYYALYQLTAERLGAARTRFHGQDDSGSPFREPNIIIEDMRVEKPKKPR